MPEHVDDHPPLDRPVRRLRRLPRPRASTASATSPPNGPLATCRSNRPPAVRLVDSTENAKAVRDAIDALVERSGRRPGSSPCRRRTSISRPNSGASSTLPGQRGADLAAAARQTADGAALSTTRASRCRRPPLRRTTTSVAAFADRHGWPVLVKPRRGTASAGITRLDTPEELGDHDFPADGDLLVQIWLPDQVLHVDGIFTGEALGAWRASRYLSTCLEFTTGAALGSVEIDDAELLRRDRARSPPRRPARCSPAPPSSTWSSSRATPAR